MAGNKAKKAKSAAKVPKHNDKGKAKAEAKVAGKSKKEKKVDKEREKRLEELKEKRKMHEELVAAINDGLADERLKEFLITNIGRYAIEVIKRLDVPKTDEQLAGELNVKVNEVRRVLNLLGGYGVTRYESDKDSKGWIEFSWHFDKDKFYELRELAHKQAEQKEIALPEECNDFFICEKCYNVNKIVLPFDTAFEYNFKCPECGRQLKRLSKEEVETLIHKENEKQAKDMKALA